MILLMRHADAVSDEVDAVRPLSQKGRDQVARVCEVLRKVPGIDPDEIWHSPLVRSRETAELLAKGLGLKGAARSGAGPRARERPSRGRGHP